MFNHPVPGQNSFINYQEFLSSGTFYRPKGQKYTRAWIMCVGGGAGRLSGYSAGGPGACMLREVFLSQDSYNTSIGAGGSGTVWPADGGDTYFGSNLVIAKGGRTGGAMGDASLYGRNNLSYTYSSFKFTDYGVGYEGQWTYKRCRDGGFNGSTGANSGAGSGVNGAPGWSGYCIVFYEETIKNRKLSLGTYQHLKKQSFSSSGTFYRPTRYPVTLAYVCLKNTDTFSRSYYTGATFFLIEDSYTVTIGTNGGISSFGTIFGSNNSPSNYCSVDCLAKSGIENSTGRISHIMSENFVQTEAWVMYYE
jgi:hypothetical protein